MSSDPLLQAAIRIVAHGEDADATLGQLLDLARQAAGADGAVALLWDASQGALAVAGSRGIDEAAASALASGAANIGHPAQRAAHERVRVVDESGVAGAESGFVSSWPIVAGRDGVEEPLGALVLTSGSELGAEPADEVAAIADLIALTADRTRLASEGAEQSDWHERISNSDALTGLANARTLSRVVELEIARAARQSSELCVAIFDVDGLGGINDAAGRSAGDNVLREIAAVASESVRFVDTLARWGGDEFILVAPGATGTTVARRIVEAVAARPPIGGRSFTVSAGLARFPADGTDGEALVEAATAALRAAQAMGPGTLAEAVPAS